MTTQVNTFTDIEAEDYATTGKNATINCVVLSDGPITDSLPSEYVYKMISSDSYKSYIRAGYVNVQIKSWTSTISSSERSSLQIPSIYKYKADSVKYINVNANFNKQLYPDNSGYIGYPILDCEELQITLPDQSIITVTPDTWKVVNITSNSTDTTYWCAVELNKAELYLGLDNGGQLYIYTTESAGAPKYQYEDLQLKILIGECGDGASSDFDRHIDEYLYDVYIFSKPESTAPTLTTNGFNYISFFSLTSSESEPTSNSKLLASRQLGYYIPFITGQNGKIDKIFIRVKSDRWDESKIAIDVIFDPDYQEHLDLVAGTNLELTTGVGFTPNHSVNPSSQEITLPQFIANDTTINITNNTNAKNIFQYVGDNPTRLRMDTDDYLNYSYYLWYYWKPDDIIERLDIWYNYFGTWRYTNEKITINNSELPGPYIGFNDEFGSFLYSYWYNQAENQLILILAGSNQYHHTDIYCIDMTSANDSTNLEKINLGTTDNQYRMKVNRWFNDIYFVWNNKLYTVNVDPDKVLKVNKPVIIDGNQFTYDIRCLFTGVKFSDNPTEDHIISTWDHMPQSDISYENLFPNRNTEVTTAPGYLTRFHFNPAAPLYLWDSAYKLVPDMYFQFEDLRSLATAHNEPTTVITYPLTDGSGYVHFYRYYHVQPAIPEANLIKLEKNSTTSAPNNTYWPCLMTKSQSATPPDLIADIWYPAIMEQTTTVFIRLVVLTSGQTVFPCNVVLPEQYTIAPEITQNSNRTYYNPEFSDIGDVIITAGNDDQNNRRYSLQPLIANQSLNPSVDEDLPLAVEIKIDELNAKPIQGGGYNISSCFNQYTIDSPSAQTPLIAMYVLSVQHIRWLEEHEYEIYYVGPAYTVGRRIINNQMQYLFLSKTINGCKSEGSCYNWERLRVILNENEVIDSFADTGIIIKDSGTKKYYELKDLALSNRKAETFTPDIKDRYVTVSFVTSAAKPLPRRIFPTTTTTN